MPGTRRRHARLVRTAWRLPGVTCESKAAWRNSYGSRHVSVCSRSSMFTDSPTQRYHDDLPAQESTWAGGRGGGGRARWERRTLKLSCPDDELRTTVQTVSRPARSSDNIGTNRMSVAWPRQQSRRSGARSATPTSTNNPGTGTYHECRRSSQLKVRAVVVR